MPLLPHLLLDVPSLTLLPFHVQLALLPLFLQLLVLLSLHMLFLLHMLFVLL
jgi:hypothetical protein